MKKDKLTYKKERVEEHVVGGDPRIDQVWFEISSKIKFNQELICCVQAETPSQAIKRFKRNLQRVFQEEFGQIAMKAVSENVKMTFTEPSVEKITFGEVEDLKEYFGADLVLSDKDFRQMVAQGVCCE